MGPLRTKVAACLLACLLATVAAASDVEPSLMVHAFYYLWYGTPEVNGRWQHWDHEVLPHWTPSVSAQYPQIGTRFKPPHELHCPFYPAGGPYSSSDPQLLRRHFRELREAGVGVAAISWWGPEWRQGTTDTQGVSTDKLLPLILRAAEEEGMAIAFHLEPYPSRTAATTREDLLYLMRRVGASPAVLRLSQRGSRLMAARPSSGSSSRGGGSSSSDGGSGSGGSGSGGSGNGSGSGRSDSDAGGAGGSAAGSVGSAAPSRQGLPLFYVYDSYHIPPGDWAQLLQPEGEMSLRGSEADGIFVGLWLNRRDGDTQLLPGGFDGFYTYFSSEAVSYGADPANWAALSSWAQQHGKVFIPSVGPGYDDSKIRPWNAAATRAREGGNRYRRWWEAALAASPAAISITSFNEWGEGTQIEVAKVLPTSDSSSELSSGNAGAAARYESYGSTAGRDEWLYMNLTAEFAMRMGRQEQEEAQQRQKEQQHKEAQQQEEEQPGRLPVSNDGSSDSAHVEL